MDSPENSGFNVVHRTLSVGWNVDRLESAAIARAEKTDGARGTDCFGGAQAFVGLGFGTHSESTPPERASDDQFSDRVNAGHQKGFPSLQ